MNEERHRPFMPFTISQCYIVIDEQWLSQRLLGFFVVARVGHDSSVINKQLFNDNPVLLDFAQQGRVAEL